MKRMITEVAHTDIPMTNTPAMIQSQMGIHAVFQAAVLVALHFWCADGTRRQQCLERACARGALPSMPEQRCSPGRAQAHRAQEARRQVSVNASP